MPYEISLARLGNGLQLPYVERGDGSGVPVVLLHGYAESWRSFELLLPDLPRTIRALALSQRGHGGPATLASEYSLEALAADVGAFMDAVGLDAAVIVGSSSGGYTAQRFAADHPERAIGLVLIGSPRTLHDVSAIDAFGARLAAFHDPIDPTFVREFVASTLSRPVPEAFLETMIGESLEVPLRVWRATLEALTEATPPTETSRIAAPTLILWGDRDEFVSRNDAEALAKAIPESELRVYEGIGHAVLWEEPDRVAADIVGFVERLGP